MKIVQLSQHDYAGSGYKYMQAVKRADPTVEVHCFIAEISRARKRFKYTTGTPLTQDNINEVRRHIRQADVIHFKGDDLPLSTWEGITIPPGKLKILTVGGSTFRRGDSSVAYAAKPISEYVTKVHIRTTLTPDLNYPEYKGIYLPQPIDSLNAPHMHIVGLCPVCDTRILTNIVHSPSNRAKKGTSVVMHAITKLKEKRFMFDFDLIEDTPHDECIQRKRKATVFIDQISETGAFGNNALEAMQYGIPTIARISQEAINQSGGIWDNLPVISCEGKNELFETLKWVIKTPHQLKAISKATKEYTDKYHSYEAVGKRFLDIINEAARP